MVMASSMFSLDAAAFWALKRMNTLATSSRLTYCPGSREIPSSST